MGTGAAVSAVATLIRLPTLSDATFAFSDAPVIGYLADASRTGQGPLRVLTQSSVGIIALDEGLSAFPSSVSRFLIQWTGPILALVAAFLLLRSAHLAGGRRMALALLCLVVIVPPILLWPLLFPDNHIFSIFTAALLAWHLVRTAGGSDSTARTVWVGLAAGAAVAGDLEVVVVGLIPFLVTVAMLRQRLARLWVKDLAWWVGAAVVAYVACQLFMAWQQISSVTSVPSGSLTDKLSSSVAPVLHIPLLLIGGGWYGSPITAATIPAIVGSVAVVVLLTWIAWRTATHLRSLGNNSADAIAVTRIFWVTSLVGLVSAFVLLGYGLIDPEGHYLTTLYVGVVALLATLAIDGPEFRRADLAASVACIMVGIFGVGNVFATRNIDAAAFNEHLAPAGADDPLPVLEAHHLVRGYAGYWNAYSLDWRSEGRLDVWPVVDAPAGCAGPPGALCPEYVFAPQGEYQPRPTTTTFLLTPGAGTGCIPALPPLAVFGPPTAVYHAGSYTISVYNYDVASRFTSTKPTVC